MFRDIPRNSFNAFWHKLYRREHNTRNVLLSIILEAPSKSDEVQYQITYEVL
jgi:hypothetical protein